LMRWSASNANGRGCARARQPATGWPCICGPMRGGVLRKPRPLPRPCTCARGTAQPPTCQPAAAPARHAPCPGMAGQLHVPVHRKPGR
jgi:hypothetical protein